MAKASIPPQKATITIRDKDGNLTTLRGVEVTAVWRQEPDPPGVCDLPHTTANFHGTLKVAYTEGAIARLAELLEIAPEPDDPDAFFPETILAMFEARRSLAMAIMREWAGNPFPRPGQTSLSAFHAPLARSLEAWGIVDLLSSRQRTQLMLNHY